MLLEIFQYKYRNVPLIPGKLLKELLHEKFLEKYISLDLGISVSRIIKDSNVIYFEEYNTKLKLNGIVNMRIKDNSVYALVGDEFLELSIPTKNRFYKLKAPYPNKAPTIEISGIHMHRIKDIDPWKDSLIKVKRARIKKSHVVLDTCTGLGYTAIGSLRFGASKVYTVEIDENVLALSQLNPWSRFLEDKRITIFLGDVYDVVDVFEDEAFDRIIHDPPRFSLSGHLYSESFYRKLYRKLKPGGILFHYTGTPGEKRRVSITKGVAERLRRVGFYVRVDPISQGVIAFKPRV